MAEKRRRDSDHYGKAMFRTEAKKPKHYQTESRNGSSTEHPPSPNRNKNKNKNPAADMQTGLISLLDEFMGLESPSSADSKDILHHAHALRRLLAARATAALPTQTKRDLDATQPNKKPHVTIPPYMTRVIRDAAGHPPIPPITEPHLEEAVFTHVSAKANVGPKGFNADSSNYEQLELVGDSYLGVMGTRIVSDRFPHIETGKQSALRQDLVNNENLSKFSAMYGLGERLQHKLNMDTIQDKKGWVKIQADVFEAYIAAIILSDPAHGFDTAEAWMTELWAPQLLAYRPPLLVNPDAKNEIARQLGGKGVKTEYRETKPMVHKNGVQQYVMGVYLTGWGYTAELLGTGEGQNKGQASMNAAHDALKKRSEVFESACLKKKQFYAFRGKEKEKEEKGAAPADGGSDAGVNGVSGNSTADKGKRKAEERDETSPKKSRVENEYVGNVKKKRKDGEFGGELVRT
ncbi:ribonuclease III [Amniculicola lignicola CBS 123094]|uniref:Ribonuclease III n=1 Tax=Amniculicola lignicola CBS 123094 TaxID=1392246 RepID=A0A6A5WMW0_9PLEO|nr:ribonuclease III [Amniculicola lignicola CBS 123094]